MLNSLRTSRAIALVLAAAAAPALAAPASTRPSDAAEPCAWLTLAPIDRVDAAFAGGGYAGLGDQIAAAMSGLQLVAAAEVDRAAPAQAVAVIAEGMDSHQAGAFAIPAVPSAVPLERFAASGKPIDGHPDAVALPGAVLCRTPGHVIVGPLAAAVLSITPDSIAAPVRDAATLLELRLDVRTMRRVAPVTFERSIAGMAAQEEPSSGNASQDAGRRLGREAAADFIRRLDDVSVRLRAATAPTADAGARIALDVRYAPFTLPAVEHPATFARPTLPADAIARLDVRYPIDSLLPAIRTGALLHRITAAATRPAAAVDEMIDFTAAAADLVFGDATSFAVVRRTDASLVVYGVSQRARPDPLAARIDRAEAALNALAKREGDAQDLRRTTYEDGGRHVERLELIDKGERFAVIDLTETPDGRTLMSMSADDAHLLVAAVGNPRDEAIASPQRLASLAVDLPMLRRTLHDSADAEMPPGAAAILDKLLAAGQLNMDVDCDGTALTIGTQLPLANVGAAMTAAMR